MTEIYKKLQENHLQQVIYNARIGESEKTIVLKAHIVMF